MRILKRLHKRCVHAFCPRCRGYRWNLDKHGLVPSRPKYIRIKAAFVVLTCPACEARGATDRSVRVFDKYGCELKVPEKARRHHGREKDVPGVRPGN